jgi:ring-1,2-phenylacetyl-CoA epoxidase subunit PaaC
VRTDQSADTSGAASPAYLLRLGDNALVLSQRLVEWCGHGPALEEDIALANIALDLLGQARMLLSHAGAQMQPPRDEDSLAYWRDTAEYRNYIMLELPNSGPEKGQQQRDYAITICRNFLYSGYALLQWQALARCRDPQLAAISAKALKETRYHWRHASDWMLRLGDGTEESHRRTQRALDILLPYAKEFFLDDELDIQASIAQGTPLPSSLRRDWEELVTATASLATLEWPASWAVSRFAPQGRQGLHSEHMDYLLAEMQVVARAHPGARW